VLVRDRSGAAGLHHQQRLLRAEGVVPLDLLGQRREYAEPGDHLAPGEDLAEVAAPQRAGGVVGQIQRRLHRPRLGATSRSARSN